MTVAWSRSVAASASRSGTRTELIVPPTRLARPLLIATDAAASAVAVAAASAVPGGVERGSTAYLFVALWVAIVGCTGEYRLPGSSATRGHRLLTATLIVPTTTLLATEVLDYPLSAATVTAVCAGSAAIGALARVIVERAGQRGALMSGVTHRVVLAGTADTLPRLRSRIQHAPVGRFSVVAACLTGEQVLASDEWDDVPVVHDLQTCAWAARGNDADAVILAPDHTIAADVIQRLCWSLEEAGVGIFVWPGLLNTPTGRTRLDLWDGLPLLHLSAPRRLGPTHAIKHLIDRFVAAIALVALTPIFLALAIAIRLDSPGPVFFRQVRVGILDAPFTMWKLRTMAHRRTDARSGSLSVDELAELNEADGPLFKVHDDPRVTRVGRWLRRMSLDELPQLINVALGQMSLVGPRPALPDEVHAYPPDVRHRLVVRPGMTGLWQVSGRSDLPWEETVRLDQSYVDNWSLLLDARILLRTAGAVLTGRGAY